MANIFSIIEAVDLESRTSISRLNWHPVNQVGFSPELLSSWYLLIYLPRYSEESNWHLLPVY